MEKRLTLFFLFLFPILLWAQWDIDSLRQDSTSFIRSNEKWDILYQRGFLLNQDFKTAAPDSAPYQTARSGTTSFGLSFNFRTDKKITFHVQTTLSVFKLYFDQVEKKSFPTISDSNLTYEKVRTMYATFPVGIRYVFKRDDKNRIKSFIELGAIPGRFIGSTHKIRKNINGETQTIKIDDQANKFRWYYAVYARIHYRWFGLWCLYRLSPIYEKNASYITTNGGGIGKFPKFPGLEFGVSVVF